MCTVGDAEGNLEDHQQKDIGILDDLADLLPLEAVVLHASLVTSNTIDGINTLLLVEKSCVVGGIGEENSEHDGPGESDETEDDEEPLRKGVSGCYSAQMGALTLQDSRAPPM